MERHEPAAALGGDALEAPRAFERGVVVHAGAEDLPVDVLQTVGRVAHDHLDAGFRQGRDDGLMTSRVPAGEVHLPDRLGSDADRVELAEKLVPGQGPRAAKAPARPNPRRLLPATSASKRRTRLLPAARRPVAPPESEALSSRSGSSLCSREVSGHACHRAGRNG
jgi:hypothetical protein